MQQSKVNIYPLLATWKKSKSGKCPIYIRVDVDGRPAVTKSTKRSILPEEWDASTRQVRSCHPYSALLNALIRRLISEHEGTYLRMEAMGQKLTVTAVKESVKGAATGTDFYGWAAAQIELAPDSESNKKHNRKHLNKLRAYSPKLTFSDISYSFFEGFENHLRNEIKNANNTAWADFKFLRHMLNVAIAKGLLQRNPMQDYKAPRLQQTVPPYLEWDEVLKIQEALIKEEMPDRLRRIGYSFLLQCFAGFRFSDVSRFRWNLFVRDEDGGQRLVLSTAKTGAIVAINFTSHIRLAAEYLRDNPLPAITNQDYNRQLKVLAIVAKVGKSLSSHMGRHTFGMRCAELGMAIDDVAKLLGHTDSKMTRIYFRIKNKRLDEAMSVWDTR